MLKYGTNTIGKLYFGSNEIKKAYYGSNLIFQSGSGPTPPPYDAKVEWIATNGGPYIDLGIRGNAEIDGLYIDFQPSSVINQARLIAASYVSEATPCQIYVNGSNLYGYRMGSAWGNAGPTTTIGTNRHTWFCDYFNLVNVIDGNSYAMGSSSSGITPLNLFLAGYYGSNQPLYKGKIYACKIYRRGNLLIDLIPVRVGTTGYMFDQVSQALFPNAGSGAFTYGNDIIE